jgi:hypothetical protein
MVPGACFGLVVSVVGLVTIPLGLLVALALGRRSNGRERLGLLAGIGVTITFVGSLHADYRACSRYHGVLTSGPGQRSFGFSCGGVDGPHWLIVGIGVTLAAAILYSYEAQRSRGAAGARFTARP